MLRISKEELERYIHIPHLRDKILMALEYASRECYGLVFSELKELREAIKVHEEKKPRSP